MIWEISQVVLLDDERANQLSDPELLLYRSNLLGSYLEITNFGGGNTLAKISGIDPLTNNAARYSLGEGLRRRIVVDEAGRFCYLASGKIQLDKGAAISARLAGFGPFRSSICVVLNGLRYFHCAHSRALLLCNSSSA